MLTVSDVSVKYGVIHAVENVTFQLQPGEIVGLIGENGAGKTSLMKAILRYHPLEHGKILLDNEPITEKNIERFAFATSEHSFFPNLTPKEHMEFYQMQFPRFNMVRFESLMKFFSLSWGRKLGYFSTGQKNQFEIVLALSQGADYIFMDEPFAGNDLFNREDFYKVLLGILSENECIVLSTHLIDEVKNFIGRALLLHNGELIEDITLSEIEENGEDFMEHLRSKYQMSQERIMEVVRKNQGDEL